MLHPNLLSQKHLFFTDLEQDIPITDIVRKLYITHKSSLPPADLASFLQLSPWNFYVEYAAPHYKVQRWREVRRLSVEDILVCRHCFKDILHQKKKTEEFLAAQKSGLKTLDLFAGCGSFSLAMKNIAGVNTTHAIEISPSAAQTLKYI